MESPPPPNPMEPEKLFTGELDRIESIVGSICRRNGLYGDAAAEFASWVKFRLIKDDYAVLRKFEGRSNLSTYLYVVVSNFYRDHRIRMTGKWRPSAISRRLGPAAVRLDALMNRDGLSMTEAVRLLLHQDGGEDLSERELRELAVKVPDRPRRRFTGSEALAMVSGSDGADAEFRTEQRLELVEETHDHLADAMGALPEEDRVIIRMHYLQGLTVASIARTLGLDQKPLYRRIKRVLGVLRGSLEDRGVDVEDVAEILMAEEG